MSLFETGTKTRPALSVEQTEKRLTAAKAAHEKAQAALAQATDAKGEALTFGATPSALSKARQTVAERESEERDRREELEAAQRLHAVAVKAADDRAEAERLQRVEAARVLMMATVSVMDAELDVMAEKLHAVESAQAAYCADMTRDELRDAKQRIERANLAFISCLVRRIKFFPGLGTLTQYDLPWNTPSPLWAHRFDKNVVDIAEARADQQQPKAAA